MFSTSGRHSKDHIEEVIRIQSVANSLSDIKEELIRDAKKHELEELPLNINRNSRRDLHLGGIPTLTEAIQNRPAELLHNSGELEPERSLELTTFSHHPQSSHPVTEISLESINNVDNTLTLDQNHYYDGLNNAPIMVYQMPSGNIVPFDSLVSVPISKPIEGKTNDHVDLLDATYSSNGEYTNSTHPVAPPLYIMSDVNKFRNHENEKMLISQIYSTDDPTNLFLDSRQTYIRNSKCEINIGESITTDLNLASHNNFESSIPMSSVADINQFPITSTDTDSEVALTLASLGNLKNDKIPENYHENLRVFDPATIKERESYSIKEKTNLEIDKSKDESSPDSKREACPTLVLRSRKGRSTIPTSATETQGSNNMQNINNKKGIDISTEVKSKTYPNTKNKSSHINKPTRAANANSKKTFIQTKSNCEPRKENLLGQLLKASKHCEPASLIPEGVVDDVVPSVGYRIMDMSNLSEMIRMMHKCSNISSRGLIVIQEQASLREGAVSHLSIICTGCQEGAVCATSNKSHNQLFDINSRVEQLTKEFNVEESQVQRMLEILGIFYRPCDKTLQELNVDSSKEEEGSSKKKKRKVTKIQKEKTVECEVCQKKFYGVNHLKSHMYMHDSFLHTCPYCQAYFKRVFNLQEHVKKHKNIKYECDICNKSYTDRSTLHAHKKSFHQEQYKMECEVCSKKFYHKTHYVEHMRVHSGEKPFACDICGKRFPYVNCMKRHMRSHCAVAKYKCRLCGKHFRLLFGIRQHLFQQHKLKKSDIEAQVKTELIAEALPPPPPNRKVSSSVSLTSAAEESILPKLSTIPLNDGTEQFLGDQKENLKTCSANVSAAVLVDGATTSDLQQPSIYTNLNDWKKPL